MSRWRVQSATATKGLCLAGLTLLLCGNAQAGDSIERLVSTLAVYDPSVSAAGVDSFRETCGDSALCAARALVAAGDGRARLEAAQHADSDTIRWVTSATSLRDQGWTDQGQRSLALDRFGRKVESELRALLATSFSEEPPIALLIDLRNNSGGDFQRMLKIAGLFTGPVEDAVILRSEANEERLGLAGSDRPIAFSDLTVLVGPATASSGEILAALLRRHAGARILGETTAGKDYLLRILPLDQDWRLLFPAETILVPGEILSGGLRPDGPWPEVLPLEGAG